MTWDQVDLTGTEVTGQYVVLKANEVLAKYMPEVQKQADVIIVLSNMGYEEDQVLSSSVPGIDLIVGGRSRMPLAEGWENVETGTVVVQAGSQGEWIGGCELNVDSAGRVTSYASNLVLLTEDYPDDAEMRAFLNTYKAQ